MTTIKFALHQVHSKNIDRYQRLLKTHLTDVNASTSNAGYRKSKPRCRPSVDQNRVLVNASQDSPLEYQL